MKPRVFNNKRGIPLLPPGESEECQAKRGNEELCPQDGREGVAQGFLCSPSLLRVSKTTV